MIISVFYKITNCLRRKSLWFWKTIFYTWSIIPPIFAYYRFFALNLGIVYLYYNSFQKIDDEEYGGASEILKEGLMTSFAAFLVPFVFNLNSLHVFEMECRIVSDDYLC